VTAPNSTVVDSRSSLRLLLVEDDPTARDVALLLLSRLGYEADLASDGLTAVEAAMATVYDVVLMDIQMPRMDGVEATRRIRSDVAGQTRPTIIAMTADASPQCRERCRAAGMDRHLPKPMHLDELAESLDRELLRLLAPDRVVGSAPKADVEVARHSGPTGIGHPPSDLDHHAVFDSGILDALVADLGGDGAVMRRDLIESYLLDVEERLTMIAAAGDDSDLAALAFQAHALKSASAMIGLIALSEVANDVESLAQTVPAEVDTGDEATRLATSCSQAMESLRSVLES
jgi:CheY-like chemotaxis protein